jgi:NitT/TauT family transport system ATP-binding protein
VASVSGTLEVRIAEKHFTTPGAAPRTVLRAIDFDLAPGEFAALVGPSGAGKTTLLNIIAGLDADYAGSVRFAGRPPGEARIGYVFQEPRLLPWRTVYDNVALVLEKGADRGRARELLDEVGLGDAGAAYPQRLSLGMARRAALARALAVEPELLLMDEPFVSLDQARAERLRRLLLRLWRMRRCAVLFVTHDLHEAVALADRVLLIGGTPSRLVGEVPVPLARDARGDRAALDALCDAIVARQRLAAAAHF